MLVSHAAIHRVVAREIKRRLLAQALREIDSSTHAVIGRRHRTVYCYGDAARCRQFSSGIERDVLLVEMSDRMRAAESAAKVHAYGGLS